MKSIRNDRRRFLGMAGAALFASSGASTVALAPKSAHAANHQAMAKRAPRHADGVEVVTASDGRGDWAASVTSVAALKELNAASLHVGQRIWVDGYHDGSTRGGGVFIVVDDPAPDDGGHLFAPNAPSGSKKYRRANANPMHANVIDFGAVGDGATSDQAAFERAIAALSQAAIMGAESRSITRAPGGTLELPPTRGGYLLTDTLTFSSSIVMAHILGGGRLYQKATNKGFFRFTADGRQFPDNTQRLLEIRDLWFEWKTKTSNPGAVAIDFGRNTIGGATNQVSIDNCYFYKGFRCIQSDHNRKRGYTSNLFISQCQCGGMSGAFLYLAAQTNTSVAMDKCWLQYAGRRREYVVDVYASGEFSMFRCSLEAGGNGNDCCQIAIRNSPNTSIISSRWEWGDIPNGKPVIHVENTQGGLNLHSVSFHNLDVAAGKTAVLLRQWHGITDVTGKFQLQRFNCNRTGTLYICDTKFHGKIYWDATYREMENEDGDRIYFYPAGDAGVVSQPDFKPLPRTV